MRLRKLIQVSMMAALTAVGALVTVPLGPVPFTLQSLMVPLSGALLGPVGGLLSQVVYLLLGFAGLPVFAGFSSGISALARPSGGFLLAFPLAAAVAGWLSGGWDGPGRGHNRGARAGGRVPGFWRMFAAMIAADAVVFAIGVPWLAYVLGPAAGKGFDLLKALRIGFLPFALTDLFKLAVAAGLAIRVRTALGAGWAAAGQEMRPAR